MALFKKPQSADVGPTPIAAYKIIYKGGFAELPKAKVAGIELLVWPDRFELLPTAAARKFWQPLTVPYQSVTDVQIVTRQVGAGETLLAGRNAQNLLQDNNIHFHYADPARGQVVLRVEMLTGVTVQGQAKRAAEFNDLLQARGIRRLFHEGSESTGVLGGGDPLADQLAKLAELFQAGALSDVEYAQAKARLLG